MNRKPGFITIVSNVLNQSESSWLPVSYTHLVTSVEDVETVVREETRGEPNLMKFIEQMNERLMKQMNEKFDRSEESFKQMKEVTKEQNEVFRENLRKQISEDIDTLNARI